MVPGTNMNAGVATTVPAFPGFPTGVISGNYGPVSFDLTQSTIYNPAFVMAQGGLANAEAALIGGIEGGLTYFNIHTVNNGGGEIRGELIAVRPHRRCGTAGPDRGEWGRYCLVAPST